MSEASVTRKELNQAIHVEGSEPDPSCIRRAYLERDGSISVVPRSEEPRILEVSVENGVQTIRIKLE